MCPPVSSYFYIKIKRYCAVQCNGTRYPGTNTANNILKNLIYRTWLVLRMGGKVAAGGGAGAASGSEMLVGITRGTLLLLLLLLTGTLSLLLLLGSLLPEEVTSSRAKKSSPSWRVRSPGSSAGI